MSIRQLRTYHRRLCGLALLAWPWAGWTQAPLGLDQVLDAALANIEVSIRQRLLDAAQADVVSADRSPLPVLSARTSSIDLQNGIGGGNMWRDKRIDKGVGLDYTMERGNKRDLRTRTAQRSVQAAEQDLAQTRRQQGRKSNACITCNRSLSPAGSRHRPPKNVIKRATCRAKR